MNEITDAFVEFDIDNDGTITTKVILSILRLKRRGYTVKCTVYNRVLCKTQNENSRGAPEICGNQTFCFII